MNEPNQNKNKHVGIEHRVVVTGWEGVVEQGGGR